MSGPDRSRGQAALAAVCVALVLVTVVVGAVVTVADDALAGAEGHPLERRAARTLAARLVAADANTTFERNVVNRTALAGLSNASVDRLAPTVAGRAVRIRVDDRVVFERGTPGDGPTVRRLVRVGTRERRRRRAPLTADRVSLEERTDRIDLHVDPGDHTAVRTVRLNDRIVLHNDSGVVGNATLRPSRHADATLTFEVYGNVSAGDESSGTLRGTTNRTVVNGSVGITSYPLNTTAGTLEVTVGA